MGIPDEGVTSPSTGSGSAPTPASAPPAGSPAGRPGSTGRLDGELRRRLYRTAGIGGIGAAVAWAAQPVAIALVAGDAGDGADFAHIASHPFNGVIEGTIFSAIGVGLLFLVTAVGRIAAASGVPNSTSALVGHTLGIAACLAWFGVAGVFLAQYTSVGSGLGDAAPERALQLGLYQVLGVIATALLVVYGVCFAGWLVTLAVAGRRRSVIGWPLSILALLAAGASIGQFLVPFAPPWGLIAGIGFAFIAGISFLVTARRAA
ncbi:hypothetical protein [Agromyces bauzanensis]